MAGAKAWLQATGAQGRTVVAVTSGANINFERLRLVSELADLGSSTEVGGSWTDCGSRILYNIGVMCDTHQCALLAGQHGVFIKLFSRPSALLTRPVPARCSTPLTLTSACTSTPALHPHPPTFAQVMLTTWIPERPGSLLCAWNHEVSTLVNGWPPLSPSPRCHPSNSTSTLTLTQLPPAQLHFF